jgi:uncharacterized repeat protein (TIGR02543 family)
VIRSFEVTAALTDTVTFNSQGGSPVAQVSGPSGTSITLPGGPTRAGYVFNGWFTQATGGTQKSGSYLLNSNGANVNLYAQWSPATGPLSCTTGFLQAEFGQLYAYQPSTGISSRIGPKHPRNYNAMGYNKLDGYLYAISVVANQPRLLKIGASGVPIDLGTPTPSGFSWSNSFTYLAADTDDSGNLYVRVANSTLIKIDLSTKVATRTSLTTTLGRRASAPGNDLAWITGDLYTMSGNVLSVINASTGHVNTRTVTGLGAIPSSFGAAYSSGPGNLVFFSNQTGKLATISNYTTANPTASIMTTSRNAPSVDGASCR